MLSADITRVVSRNRRRDRLDTTPVAAAAEPARSGVGDPLAHPAASGSSAAADWDDMHDAVAERLRDILEATAPGIAPPESRALAMRSHALALECAGALHRLRTALTIDRESRRRLECELTDARASLARIQLDIEHSRAGELQARHLAFHDELTALPNRRHCRERLEQALALAAARRTTAALLYLDLDGFKVINDRHGHEVGDEVLRIVAARLNRTVRAGDIVCRLGGDEFVCLPSDPMEGAQLAHLAGKLFAAVSAPLTFNQLSLEIRPSIGVAIYPVHAADTEGLLKAADAAMYLAKLRRSGFAFAERNTTLNGRSSHA